MTGAGVIIKDVAEDWYSSGQAQARLVAEHTDRLPLGAQPPLNKTFGELRIESIRASRIERWRDEQVADHSMSRRKCFVALLVPSKVDYLDSDHRS